jgi:hypothetical protein
MRFSRSLVTLAIVGAAACGPTYVVQGPPPSQRVPVPPRVDPLQVNIVRPEEGRVLIQTSRPAYVAVFEVVPGRGVSLVYPAPYRPRDVMLTGLTWVNLSWTMRYDYDRRFASSETRYIYAVASDAPLRLSDEDYDRRHLERMLGSAYWSQSPNVTVRALSRVYVPAEPDEWWGEDMYSMALTNPRVTVTIRLARVYCPGGTYFEIRDDLMDHVWCPSRPARGGGRPLASAPDSVIGSNGRRVGRSMNPGARTPVYRVPATTEVQQQGQTAPPRYPPRTQPQNPQIPANQPPQNQPPQNQPPQNQPPQNQPPQNQPPQTHPPQNQPPQNPPQDPNGRDKDHEDNGRRAHGDPRNSDPRGNGNGYGNGGREQPATQPPPAMGPATPPPANPQPQQQPPETQPGNGHQDHGNNGNSNPGNSANPGNSGNQGDKANSAKPAPNDVPAKNNDIRSLLKNRYPQAKKDDKKPASDSTDKKKP